MEYRHGLTIGTILLSTTLLGFHVGGCSNQDPSTPASSGCQTVQDCPMGKVCNPESAECVAFETDTLTGTFHCLVKEPNSAASEESTGSSTVMAMVSDRPLSFSALALCEYYPSDTPPGLMIRVSAGGDVAAGVVGYHALIILDLSKQVPPSTYTFGPTQCLTCTGAGSLHEAVSEAENKPIAYVQEAKVVLSGDPVVGEWLDGTITARIASPAEGTKLSAPCPNGLVDCGTVLDQDFACKPSSGGYRICAKKCAAQIDCDALGGLCVQGACMLPCESADDPACVDPISCKKVSAAAPHYGVCN
jgi:hypothetical protein